MSYQCEVCGKFLSTGNYAEDWEGNWRRVMRGKEERPLPDSVICTAEPSFEDRYDSYSFAHKICFEKSRGNYR